MHFQVSGERHMIHYIDLQRSSTLETCDLMLFRFREHRDALHFHTSDHVIVVCESHLMCAVMTRDCGDGLSSLVWGKHLLSNTHMLLNFGLLRQHKLCDFNMFYSKSINGGKNNQVLLLCCKQVHKL